MTLSIISISTQTLINNMKRDEERCNELNAYSDYVDELTKDYENTINRLAEKYESANEKYMAIHISESEDKNLSKELQHEIDMYDKKRGKYYFKMMKYKFRINMIRTMYDAYLDMNLKKLE